MRQIGSQPETKSIVSIVEDDDLVRRAIERACRWSGFLTKSYDSAEAFLESGDATNCLITDIRLPGICGLELQERLRESDPKVAVFVITGSDDASLRNRAMASGAEGFFRKPLELEQLLDCIQRALMRTSS